MQFSAPSPSISFQLLPEDINAFSRQLKGIGALPQRMVYIGLAIVAVLLPAITFITQRQAVHRVAVPVAASSKSPFLLSYGLPLFFLAVFWFFIIRNRGNVNTKVPILRYQNRVILNPEAFSISFGAITTTVLWEGIEDVVVAPQHIFVLITPSDGYIVPRRAFDSNAEFAQFGDLARRNWLEVNRNNPPIARADGV